MEIVAFTTPDVMLPILRQNTVDGLPYQRVVALWHRDGVFGRHVGVGNTRGFDERTIILSQHAGSRLFDAFEEKPINCHKFGRIMLGMAPNEDEPILDFSGLEIVENLPEGAVGVIGAKEWGVPHTLGYGMGGESLQVMSCFGEFGIAKNLDVLGFYKQLHPNRDVDLYKLGSA